MKFNKFFLFGLLLPGVMLFAQTKALYQFLENWPATYDTTGKHWFVYDCTTGEPETHFVTETDVASQTTTTIWMAQLGNFNGGQPPFWNPGDTIVALGSIDTAYITDPGGYPDNPNHTGFYWLFGDTINSATPEAWLPADTVRPLPKPKATQVGTDVEIAIPNPYQTTSDINNYNVLGYWLWADTLGTGTPSKFDKEVGFIPVDGPAGDTTEYLHPIAGNYPLGQTIYWAYHLVATPDTGGSTCPGYSTYYMSQNSNPIIVIGIEEIPSTMLRDPLIETFPNPFRNKTTISLNTGTITENAHLKIFDVTGNLIRTYLLAQTSTSVITWHCHDQTGNKVPAGVYFVKLEAAGHAIIEKIVKVE
jgi:hypothetical protein